MGRLDSRGWWWWWRSNQITASNPHATRSAWHENREARWEAYFTAAAEEEKREAERVYQWMMHEREREELKAKLHRFYHERVDQHTWDGYVCVCV